MQKHYRNMTVFQNDLPVINFECIKTARWMQHVFHLLSLIAMQSWTSSSRSVTQQPTRILSHYAENQVFFCALFHPWPPRGSVWGRHTQADDWILTRPKIPLKTSSYCNSTAFKTPSHTQFRFHLSYDDLWSKAISPENVVNDWTDGKYSRNIWARAWKLSHRRDLFKWIAKASIFKPIYMCVCIYTHLKD